MKEKNEYISAILQAAEQIGITNVTPTTLSEGGNLLVHLAPYPVIARLTRVRTDEDTGSIYSKMNRELQVAKHLHAQGVPIVLPFELSNIEPHPVEETWMTLWEFIPRTAMQPLVPEQAYSLVVKLSDAMQSFQGELPPLGVWEQISQSAERLGKRSDPRIQRLLKHFQYVDEGMRSGTRQLHPCHGDAHARNLLASPRGPLWMDFEDASLMPAYWDIASYVANLALLSRQHDPTYLYILEQANRADQLEAFKFALTARVLMSTLGNLDYALDGMGDLAFATRQLELAGDFIGSIPSIMRRGG